MSTNLNQLGSANKKRYTIEDAMLAANLGDYMGEKNEKVFPSNSSQSEKKILNKNSNSFQVESAGNDASKRFVQNVDPIFSHNTVPRNQTSYLETSNSKSTLYSLFQQEISDILKSTDNDAEEEKINKKKPKKTRWNKPIVIPPQGDPRSQNNIIPPPNQFIPVFPFNNMTQMPQGNLNKTNKNEDTSSIESYVRRSFEKCQNEKERQMTEKSLKKILNTAKLRGEYQSRNWDTFPLPLLPRESKGSYMFNNQDMDVEKNQFNNNPSFQQGSFLAKRGFNVTNSDEAGLETGFNENGKKIFKTQGKNFGKPHQLELTKEEEERRKQRHGRFQDDFQKTEIKYETERPSRAPELDFNDEGEYDLETLAEKWKVVGTSTAVEKPYLRLTKEPDPSMIRPEPILKKSLKFLLDKWEKKEANYPYIAEQFRSMRQDLNVQHIKNKFTVKVYESNARISLECHDVNYFNQCQSRLKDLYRSGLPSKNKPEFFSYRIIYLTLCEMKNDLTQLLQELTPEELDHDFIRFSLKLRRYYETGNFKGVFDMYKNGINLSQYLLDIFIVRLRVMALKLITKTFGEKTSISYLTNILAFNDEDQLREFITSSKGVLTEDNAFLNNKESYKEYNNHPWMKLKLKTHKVL